MTALWSPAELEMVEMLTRRVRLLSEDQLRASWSQGAGTADEVLHPLKRLVDGALLLRTAVNAHPRLVIKSPLAAWRPGRRAPNAARVAEHIRNRWCHAAEPTVVYWASKKAANLFGSSAGELSPLLHRDHDLLLAEVYLHYRQHQPRLAHRWLSEDVFPKAGYCVKDPDAFLFGDDGLPERVIESAGRYGRAQVQAFHEHCVEYDLPYELW